MLRTRTKPRPRLSDEADAFRAILITAAIVIGIVFVLGYYCAPVVAQ